MTSLNRLDARQVAELIHLQFPKLACASTTFLGEGCDNSAFEVDSRWVFRLPKNEDVERQIIVEAKALPQLCRRLPVEVPNPEFIGKPCALFPRHFVGYSKLHGLPAIHANFNDLEFNGLANVLGRFLTCLHAIPLVETGDWGVGEQQIDVLIEEFRNEALSGLTTLVEVIDHFPLGPLQALLESTVDVNTSTKALTHNDLASEHLLVDLQTRTLTGVIDWTDMAISDPAIDLAGIFHWGGTKLLDAVVKIYVHPVDISLFSGARYIAACRGVGDVVYGHDTGRLEYVASGRRALGFCLGLHHLPHR